MSNQRKEQRSFNPSQSDLRDESDERVIVDRIPYNSAAVIGGMFREVIRPGFFTRAIEENDDIVAWYQHGEGGTPVLARTKSGTLSLRDTETHLEYRAELSDTAHANEILQSVQRGDLDSSSFAFVVDDQNSEQAKWDRSESEDGKLPLRELLSAERIYDMAPVVFGAYREASVGLRSAEDTYQQHLDSLTQERADEDDDVDGAKDRDLKRRRLELAQLELNEKETT